MSSVELGRHPCDVNDNIDNPNNPSSLDGVNIYNEVSSIAIGSTQTVVTYTVPAGKTLFVRRIEFSGKNVATYHVVVDLINVATKRTWFNGNLSDEFNFNFNGEANLSVQENSIISLIVENFRPMLSDFEGRIQGVLL